MIRIVPSGNVMRVGYHLPVGKFGPKVYEGPNGLTILTEKKPFVRKGPERSTLSPPTTRPFPFGRTSLLECWMDHSGIKCSSAGHPAFTQQHRPL
ncbi:hypothetical protein WJX84_001380 [Apatococcus fuscideae]|uniref:Uncharacterized protein n=1 Tax=Apatococcus fuscideae TaxID=2026836 RepID=A0AAW1T2S2_9CHLO